MKGKVLLVFPGPRTYLGLEIPLALVMLGGVLQKAGYQPHLLDMRVVDYRVDPSDFICVGISALTGGQTKYGLEFARYVRQRAPEIPIIWGGVHASLLPEQTLENEYVDVVVRGEGEITIVEVVQRLEAKESLDGVEGVSYISNGEIKHNADRQFMDINSIAIDLPYELLDLEKYPSFRQGVFPFQSDRGCPHRCGFCYNIAFNKRSCRMKDSQRVLDEIEYLAKRFKIKFLKFDYGDDNFFASRKRAEEIAEGLLHRNIKLKWVSFCRCDYFKNFDLPFLKLLEDSGCMTLFLGGESGSQRILDFIKKDITVDDTIMATEKMAQVGGIQQVTSFMSGFPSETTEELRQTFDLIDRLSEINPNFRCPAITNFTCYPGIPLHDLVVKEYGYVPPQSLVQWGDFRHGGENNATWLDKKQRKFLANLSLMTIFPFQRDAYEPPKEFAHEGRRLLKLLYRIPAFCARKRWKHRFFKAPVEWVILNKYLNRTRGF